MIKFKEWLEVNKAETSINRLNQIETELKKN